MTAKFFPISYYTSILLLETNLSKDRVDSIPIFDTTNDKRERERETRRKKEKRVENNEEKQTFQKLSNVPELWRSFKGGRDKVFRNGNRREIAYSFHTRTASKKTANQIDSSSGICSWIRSRYRVGVSFVGQPLEISLLLAV